MTARKSSTTIKPRKSRITDKPQRTGTKITIQVSERTPSTLNRTSTVKATGAITEESPSTGLAETAAELTLTTESTGTNIVETMQTSTEQTAAASTMRNVGMSCDDAKLMLIFRQLYAV
ncbi:unnamed protein product [Didymodactylos carnosus]|nr:unnamed protein product [Didymodactylos carnosus]CAF4457554.1 unnamed protein product [Didymodactylos carnosus]